MSNELVRLDSYTPEQLQIMSEQITNLRMKKYEEKLEQLDNVVKKQNEELSIVRAENESIRELEISRHITDKDRFGYVSQSDLGKKFDVSIGSGMMGKLLRIVGLAKQKQSTTEPMRFAILENYAKSIMYGGEYPSYQWNPERTINKIKIWLEGEGLLVTFFSKTTEKELHEYINELYEMYGN